jgi:hypothetical protein
VQRVKNENAVDLERLNALAYAPYAVLCAKVHIAAFTFRLAEKVTSSSLRAQLYQLFCELRDYVEAVLEKHQNSSPEWKTTLALQSGELDTDRVPERFETKPAVARVLLNFRPKHDQAVLQAVAASLFRRLMQSSKGAPRGIWARVSGSGSSSGSRSFRAAWEATHAARGKEDKLQEVDFIRLVSLDPTTPHWFDDQAGSGDIVRQVAELLSQSEVRRMIEDLRPDFFDEADPTELMEIANAGTKVKAGALR